MKYSHEVKLVRPDGLRGTNDDAGKKARIYVSVLVECGRYPKVMQMQKGYRR